MTNSMPGKCKDRITAQNFNHYQKERIMNTRKNNQAEPGERDVTTNRLENRSSVPNDLPDSEKDNRELQSEETVINLPDVKDIPGQEFVSAPPIGELGDTTVSSDDEEGKDIMDVASSETINKGIPNDVNPEERRALQDITFIPTVDEDNLRDSVMDNTDFQGEPLNERSFGDELSGRGAGTLGNSGAVRPSSGQDQNKGGSDGTEMTR